MSQILDNFLGTIQNKLPETDRNWLSDLRLEAAHIPSGIKRMQFQWSGVLAGSGRLLRVCVGVQKMGQILLGLALSIFFLVGLIYTANAPHDGMTKMVLNIAFPLYQIAAVFAVTSLSLLKRFTWTCSVLWAVVWVVLSLGLFDSSSAPMTFLRAISIEAAFMMAGLFIAANYLDWVEEARHA